MKNSLSATAFWLLSIVCIIGASACENYEPAAAVVNLPPPANLEGQTSARATRLKLEPDVHVQYNPISNIPTIVYKHVPESPECKNCGKPFPFSKIINGTDTFPLIMPDGSTIIMGPVSTLQFNKSFNKTDRNIITTGNVTFKIKKKKRLPFVVNGEERH